MSQDKLIESGSEEAREKNIETEIAAGTPPKQAVAIGYAVQRRAGGGDVEGIGMPPSQVLATFAEQQSRWKNP